MMKGKKYSALEIATAAFPEGLDAIVGEEPHIVTAEDVAANPDTPELVEGSEIMLPVMEKMPVAVFFGKYGINIGGIAGIVDPEHKIVVSEGSESLFVTVGNTTAEVALESFIPDPTEEVVGEQPVEVPAEPVVEPAPAA